MIQEQFNFKAFFGDSKSYLGIFSKDLVLKEATAAWMDDLGYNLKDLPLPLDKLFTDTGFDAFRHWCSKELKSPKGSLHYMELVTTHNEIIHYTATLKFIDGLFHIGLRQTQRKWERDEELRFLGETAKIGSFKYDVIQDKATWSKSLYKIYDLPHSSEPPNQEVFFSIVHPEDKELLQLCIERLYAQKKAYNVTFRIVTRKEQVRYIKSQAKPFVQNGEVVSVTGYAQDVSDSTFQKLELVKEKERVELAILGIKSGIFDHNLVTDDLSYGPFFRERIGLPARVKEKDFRKLIHPEDVDAAYQRHLEGIKAPGNYYFNHYRLKSKKNTYRHYEVYGWRQKDALGNPVRMVGNLIDAEENVQAQQKLIENNRQLWAMVNNGAVHMILLSLKGQVLMLDDVSRKEMSAEFGVDPMDKHAFFKDLIPVGEVKEFKKEFKRALDGKSSKRALKHIYEDGTEKWFDYIVSPVFTAAGIVQNVLLKYVDITEVKRSERSMQSAKERAEELSVMKTNFLANMSHEIRTPLNGILSAVELLPTASNEIEMQQLLSVQKESGERLLHTLTGVINLSLLEAERSSLKLTNESLLELTKSAFESFAHLARKKKLEYEFVANVQTDVIVKVDREMMIASLKNLVHNAVKFTDKGSITLQIDVNHQKGFARVRVADTGIGIKPEKIKSVFESFKQGSEGITRDFEGTGIGLSLTKKYLDLLGAEITVESTFGKGSAFTLQIALA